jgi:hypothetical protein
MVLGFNMHDLMELQIYRQTTLFSYLSSEHSEIDVYFQASFLKASVELLVGEYGQFNTVGHGHNQ